MGVFHTIAMKISGQVKPDELGLTVEKEIEFVCAKYGLKVIENKSGFCANGYYGDEE